MIRGTWHAILMRLEAGLAAQGLHLSDEVLARVFNSLLQPLETPRTDVQEILWYSLGLGRVSGRKKDVAAEIEAQGARG